jgi:hypothetical protein
MKRKKMSLFTSVLLFIFLFTTHNLSAQICTGCDDPIEATNCGAPDCEFDCPECDPAPPEPEVPVNQGILIVLAGGIAILSYSAYRKLIQA